MRAAGAGFARAGEAVDTARRRVAERWTALADVDGESCTCLGVRVHWTRLALLTAVVRACGTRYASVPGRAIHVPGVALTLCTSRGRVRADNTPSACRAAGGGLVCARSARCTAAGQRRGLAGRTHRADCNEEARARHVEHERHFAAPHAFKYWAASAAVLRVFTTRGLWSISVFINSYINASRRGH